MQTGDAAASANPDSIIMTQEAADDNGVVVGDEITVEFAATGSQVLTVGAIYENEFIIGHYMIDLSGWEQNFDSETDSVISASIAAGVDGLRADIVWHRAALAHAAWQGKSALDGDDLDAVEELVVGHRRRHDSNSNQSPPGAGRQGLRAC